MKKLFLLLFCLSTSIVINAQLSLEKFEYSETGINDYVITEIDLITQKELFSKTLNWVKETWKNPEEVLKMQIENEKLRIEGIAEKLVKVRDFGFNATYIIEISFEDNKYKFELVSLTAEKADYKKIPNFKTDKKMLKNFGTTPIDIENYFNTLNQNLLDYILGKK